MGPTQHSRFQIAYIRFVMVPAWSKPSLDSFDKDLVQELKHIATLFAFLRHWRVLLAPDSLALSGFLPREDFKWLRMTEGLFGEASVSHFSAFRGLKALLSLFGWKTKRIFDLLKLFELKPLDPCFTPKSFL